MYIVIFNAQARCHAPIVKSHGAAIVLVKSLFRKVVLRGAGT